MSQRTILDSSPVPLPLPSRSLKRSASLASLPTPPRTIKKRSRSRGSVFEFSDDDDCDVPLGTTPTSSPIRDLASKTARPPAEEVQHAHKRRKLDDLVAELSSEDRERAAEDTFWTGHLSTSDQASASQPRPRPRSKQQVPSRRRIPGAEKVQSRTSTRRVSQSRAQPSSRVYSLLSPPTSRVRPPVTPPRRASATAPKQLRVSTRRAPVRDSPNNPFLADSPATVPSSPPESRTSTVRQEKPTFTYVLYVFLLILILLSRDQPCLLYVRSAFCPAAAKSRNL
jgi:hypothetical protein